MRTTASFGLILGSTRDRPDAHRGAHPPLLPGPMHNTSRGTGQWDWCETEQELGKSYDTQKGLMRATSRQCAAVATAVHKCGCVSSSMHIRWSSATHLCPCAWHCLHAVACACVLLGV